MASALLASDYFLPPSQKPPGTAKVREQSVGNVKDNVIEYELYRVVGFVSQGGMVSKYCFTTTNVTTQTLQREVGFALKLKQNV